MFIYVLRVGVYLLFLKRRVKRRKQKATRMPQESSVHTTALNTGERVRLGSSTATCTHTHTHTNLLKFRQNYDRCISDTCALFDYCLYGL